MARIGGLRKNKSAILYIEQRFYIVYKHNPFVWDTQMKLNTKSESLYSNALNSVTEHLEF